MMIKRTEKAEKKRQGPGMYKNNMEEDEVQGEARLTHRGKRSIANCTSTPSEGLRVTWIALLVLHLACMFSQGLEIHPLPLDRKDWAETQYYNHCLGLGEQLLFLDPPEEPFSKRTRGSRLFSWSFLNKQTTILYTWQIVYQDYGTLLDNDNPTKYQQYGKWGLEVLNVTKKDEGVYIAKDLGSYGTFDHVSKINVTMLSPPKLSTWRLELTRELVNDQSVKLTCGEVIYVGDPPITLELKAADGTVLKSMNTKGNLSFIMPRADDTGNFVCEINWNISRAAFCLDRIDRKWWKIIGPSYPCRSPISTTKPAPKAPPPTTTDSTMMTPALVGLVAAGAGALVGAVIKSMMKKKAPVQAAVTSKLEHVEVAPVEPEAPRDPMTVPEEHESIYGTFI